MIIFGLLLTPFEVTVAKVIGVSLKSNDQYKLSLSKFQIHMVDNAFVCSKIGKLFEHQIQHCQ